MFALNVKKEFEDTKGRKKSLSQKTERTMASQQNETKAKHRTHNTMLKTKAVVTLTLQKPGNFKCSRRVINGLSFKCLQNNFNIVITQSYLSC